jgi:hypothetical protein
MAVFFVLHDNHRHVAPVLHNRYDMIIAGLVFSRVREYSSVTLNKIISEVL